MDNLKNLNKSVFAKTRAEELGDDVWEAFFIPPYFSRLDLRSRTKPVAIHGGRGCGKTMLLRYLSHATTFSPKRVHINTDEIEHIGLYWRIDTQFCNSMKGRGIEQNDWEDAFKHYVALTVAKEILESLQSIAQSNYETFNDEQLKRIQYGRLASFSSSIPEDAIEFRNHIESELWRFQGWASNVSRKELRPIFLPGVTFLNALISVIQQEAPTLKRASFYVYIDEFENFDDYQWRIVNDAVKHSRLPLIFNTAMKRGAVLVTETTGRESVAGMNDFETIDLEVELRQDAHVFFSEILLGAMDIARGYHNSDLLQLLRDPMRINERKEAEHIEQVKAEVNRILPSMTVREVANEIIGSPSLKNVVLDKFAKSCKWRGLPEEEWRKRLWFDDQPEVCVLLPHLLYRNSVNHFELENEVAKYRLAEKNKFSDGGWIHNNLFAAELEIYRPYQKTCPLYAGFDAFRTLSRTNLRAFLSLCYRSLELSQFENSTTGSISVPIQAQAALDASSKFMREIRTFGASGEKLYGFTYRLGNLFKVLQNIIELSEPEQNQFSVTTGGEILTNEDHAFIAEAVKHSVLIEHRETKTKQTISTDIVDYQLNPIYCPYFNISYRKKRKIELSTGQFIKLIRGSVDDYQVLIKDFSSRRSNHSDTGTGSLFEE